MPWGKHGDLRRWVGLESRAGGWGKVVSRGRRPEKITGKGMQHLGGLVRILVLVQRAIVK